MADLWNYIVVEDARPGDVAQQTLSVLGSRGWEKAEADTDGAWRLRIWPVEGGLVVIHLLDWEGADRPLARELATLRAAPVAISFFDGAGETELFAYLSKSGRGAKPPKTLLGASAQQEGDWSDRPTGDVQEYAVLPPLNPAHRLALAAIRHSIGPIFKAFGFQKVRVDVRYHPSIDAVLAFRLSLSETQSLLVRYDFSKGEALYGCSQTIVLLAGGEERELAKLECDRSSHWSGRPELQERDFRMFAAQLLKTLQGYVSKEEFAKNEGFEELAAEFEELLENKRISRFVETDEIRAEVGFWGEKLVTVRSPHLRQTFRFDTSLVEKSDDVAMSDLVELRTGAVRARRLRVGKTTVVFDELGVFLRVNVTSSEH